MLGNVSLEPPDFLGGLAVHISLRENCVKFLNVQNQTSLTGSKYKTPQTRIHT